MARHPLDSYDIRLLKALQNDDALSLNELAELVKLSPSQCSRRISKLKSTGFIRKQVTLLNAQSIGLDVEAFITVTLIKHDDDHACHFQDKIKEMIHVLECHAITGDGDYLLRVVAPNQKELSSFLMNELMKLPGVGHVKTSMALSTIKSSTALPLEF